MLSELRYGKVDLEQFAIDYLGLDVDGAKVIKCLRNAIVHHNYGLIYPAAIPAMPKANPFNKIVMFGLVENTNAPLIPIKIKKIRGKLYATLILIPLLRCLLSAIGKLKGELELKLDKPSVYRFKKIDIKKWITY
jgi:hypothetical protein